MVPLGGRREDGGCGTPCVPAPTRTARRRRSLYEERLELLRGFTLAGHCGRNRERRECRTAEVGWGVGKNAEMLSANTLELARKNRRLVRL